jgi:hypothetical protein
MGSEIAIGDDDMSAAQPNLLVKLSAALYGLAGVLVALSGVQLLTMLLDGYSIPAPLPYGLLGGGVGLLYVGTRVFRARTWAAFTALVLAPALLLVLGGWLAYSVTAIFSCIVLVSLPMLVLSGILGAVTLGGVRRAAAARARLDAAGLSLGQ